MAIEIVDFPIKNCGSFHSYVSLPEGICFDLGARIQSPPHMISQKGVLNIA